MRRIIAIVAFVLLLTAGWFFASPWLAMKGIVDAARDGDLDELEQRIDFARLREDTDARLRGEIDESTREGGLLERIGGAVAGEIAGAVVDNALTPRGIANIVTVGSFAAPLVPERYRGQELDWDVERNGLDAFEGVSTWEDGSDGPVLLFERDGIGWDLVGVELADFEIGARQEP